MPPDADNSQDRFERHFAPGSKIYGVGHRADALYLIRKGRMQLSKRARGVDRSICICGVGDVFGEEALSENAARTSTATAIEALTVLEIERARFVELLREEPDVAEHFVLQLVGRLRSAEEQLHNYMLADPCARVINSLLRADEDSETRDLAVSPLELSARTGLALNQVKGVIKQLDHGGYLSISAQRIQLEDAAALRDLYSLLDLKEDVRFGLS